MKRFQLLNKKIIALIGYINVLFNLVKDNISGKATLCEEILRLLVTSVLTEIKISYVRYYSWYHLILYILSSILLRFLFIPIYLCAEIDTPIASFESASSFMKAMRVQMFIESQHLMVKDKPCITFYQYFNYKPLRIHDESFPPQPWPNFYTPNVTTHPWYPELVSTLSNSFIMQIPVKYKILSSNPNNIPYLTGTLSIKYMIQAYNDYNPPMMHDRNEFSRAYNQSNIPHSMQGLDVPLAYYDRPEILREYNKCHLPD